MTINVTFSSETVSELQSEMRALLNGTSGGLAGETAVATGTVKTPAPKRGKGAAAEAAAQQAISSGEERVDPAADKQDAEDEAAETAKAAAEAAAKAAAETPKLTHDNVKAMLGGYVMQFGMEAAQEDGESLIGVPAVSKLADDQKVLAKAILDVMAGIEKNPKNREVNGDGITPEKIAQLKPIIAAAKAVK